MSRDKAERAGLAGAPSFGACPVPRTDTDQVLLGHGSGGLLTAQLIEDLILPAFHNPADEEGQKHGRSRDPNLQSND